MALLTTPFTRCPAALPPRVALPGSLGLAGRPREVVHWGRHPRGPVLATAVVQPDAKVIEEAGVKVDPYLSLGRSSFPPDFMFGAASAAYQIEGAYNKDGKKLSIWDTFCHTQPGKIEDGSNGDIADNSYELYEEDVKMLEEMGADVYRFSISWSRVLPDGRNRNQPGIDYYHKLIDALTAKGITPFVTLFHWDVPQALEDKYGGLLCRDIVEDYRHYVDVCFTEFGGKVKHWITFNEPSIFCMFGYTTGGHAPGRCSDREQCPFGDSATEPYIVTHNLLLAHAAAVKLYREKCQGGEIGITLESKWMIPYSNSRADVLAAARSMDFEFGWYMDPLVHGDYPSSMKALVGERLPRFTPEEKKMVKGSYDFIGINYYTSNYAQDATPKEISYLYDDHANSLGVKDGFIPIGWATGTWQYICPEGIHDLLVYTKEKYEDPKIYITETGLTEKASDGTGPEQDQSSIKYHLEHLKQVHRAIRNGVDVKGYICWSLLDDFEWNYGFTNRYGLVSISNGELKRIPKLSLLWFRKFLSS